MDIISDLTTRLHLDITTDPAVLAAHAEDKSPFHITPTAVIFPRSASEIEQIVRYVSEHKSQHPELSITMRSAGSDVSGGPLGESLILDVTKYLNHLIAIGPCHATVEPGMLYKHFDNETLKHNLHLPSFPASRDLCSIGGMVSNNSGGEKTLLYGKTDVYVQKLHVVLADGNEYVIEPLSGDALQEKLNEQSYCGAMYRELFKLITTNYTKIKNARPRVSKNSAGYALWNVWNPTTGVFDLTQLFTGSQGTLGIITQTKLKLITPTKHARLVAIFVNDLQTLPDVVAHVLPHRPETFEIYDKHVLSIILRFFPQFLSLVKSSIFELAHDFIPEMKMVLTKGSLPTYILTAEFTGDSETEVITRATQMAHDISHLPVTTHVTTSEREAVKYKTIRRHSFGLLQQHTSHKQTVTFIDDVIVRPEKLPIFIPRLRAILDKYPSVDYSIIGHIGDGNLHIIPLMDLGDPDVRDTIHDLTIAVNELVMELDGSITAEHNDGLIRSPFLRQLFGDDIYDLFVQTKTICDPHNIFNPGKKIHSRFDYALDHLKRRVRTVK